MTVHFNFLFFFFSFSLLKSNVQNFVYFLHIFCQDMNPSNTWNHIFKMNWRILFETWKHLTILLCCYWNSKWHLHIYPCDFTIVVYKKLQLSFRFNSNFHSQNKIELDSPLTKLFSSSLSNCYYFFFLMSGYELCEV